MNIYQFRKQIEDIEKNNIEKALSLNVEKRKLRDIYLYSIVEANRGGDEEEWVL